MVSGGKQQGSLDGMIKIARRSLTDKIRPLTVNGDSTRRYARRHTRAPHTQSGFFFVLIIILVRYCILLYFTLLF